MESKKVIVTGGNRGIGKGIVLSLLEHSYHVLATSCLLYTSDAADD